MFFPHGKAILLNNPVVGLWCFNTCPNLAHLNDINVPLLSLTKLSPVFFCFAEQRDWGADAWGVSESHQWALHSELKKYHCSFMSNVSLSVPACLFAFHFCELPLAHQSWAQAFFRPEPVTCEAAGMTLHTVDMHYQQCSNRSFLPTFEVVKGENLHSSSHCEFLHQFEGESVLATGPSSSGVSSLCCGGALCSQQTWAALILSANVNVTCNHTHLFACW